MGILDMLRPEWQHRDPAVRLRAVRELNAGQDDVLAAVVREDRDPAVRQAAAERLRDRELLAALATEDLPAPVRDLLRQRLDRHCLHDALQAADPEARRQAVAAMSRPETLAEFILETEDPQARALAADRLDDADALYRVAMGNCGKNVAATIVARIADEAKLAEIAAEGGNKVLRRLAAEKLAAGQAERERLTLAVERAGQVAERAEQLAQSWNWQLAADELDRLAAEAAALPASEARDDCLRRLEAARAAFAERRATHEERQQEEAHAANDRRHLEDHCRDLLGRFHAALNEHDLHAAAGVVAEWPEKLPAGDGFAALADQFTELERRRQLIRTETQRERQELEAFLARLAMVQKQVEADELTAADKNLTLIACELRHAHLDFVDIEPARQVLAAAREELDARRHARAEAEAADRAEVTRQARELVERMEALAENPARKHAERQAREHEDAWQQLDLRRVNDPEALTSRFRKACDRFHSRLRQRREEHSWEMWFNKSLKEELVAKVEAMRGEKDLPKLARDVRDVQAQWKTIGPAPHSEEEALWERFHNLCNELYGHCKEFFDEQDRQRAANQAEKEALVARAEEIRDSEDWGATADELKRIQTRWKKVGPVDRAIGDELWKRLRTACDHFFERRRLKFEEEQGDRQENLAEKLALCERAEAIAAEPDWRHMSEVKELQLRWKAGGPAPRDQEQQLWERFQTAGNVFFDWLKDQRPGFLERKQEILAKAEELATEAAATDDPGQRRGIADRLKDLQQQWKDTGPGPRKAERPLFQRFRQICDEFFQERRERIGERQAERAEHATAKQAIVEQARQAAADNDDRAAADRLKQLQQQWKAVGPAPRADEERLWREFRAVCDEFFERRREQFEARDQDREENLRQKEALVTELEDMVREYIDGESDAGEAESAEPAAANQALDLAAELQQAFAANFALAGGSSASSGPSNYALRDEVRTLQKRWKNIGPVPREHDQKLWKRWKTALDRFYDDQRR